MAIGWIKVIKITGSVGVVAFLLYYLLSELFSEKIINLFGSDKLFLIVLIIISVLSVAIMLAIISNKENADGTEKNVSITYKGKSTHNGDNKF